MATWTDDPDYSDNWSYSDSGGCSGASYGDSAGWDDWGGHYSDARYSDYSDYSDSYSDYSDSIQSSSDTKQSSDTIPVNVHGKIINMTTEQYAKYQGALSRGKSISEALTYAGVYTSDNTVPVNVNGQTVYMTIEDYARYEGTLSRAKNPKVSIQDGKIVIQDVQTQKMPQQTQQSQQNTIKLDDYFRLNTTPSSPKEPLTAPIVEISNAPGLEPYYGSGLINPNDTVAEALTRHPTVQELNTANTFENIVSAPKLSTFNPTNITVNPDIVSNVKYTNIDPFASPAMSNVERNRNAVENRINKQVNNYMNLPGRRAITQAETSIVEGLGNIGKTVAGTPGEVVGKAAGYFVAGAGELTVGTTYAAVTSVMTGKNYLTAQGELLLKGGKETVKSIAKTAITPVAPAIEGLTGIKTPRATTDDVAMTLATVAPVGLAKVRGLSIKSQFKPSSIARPASSTPKMPKNTIVEVGVSPGGKPYVIKTNERGIPVKRWTDIEVKTPSLEEQLVPKATISDYTESLTLANKNAIYKREFNPSTGIYSETLSYTAGNRRNTVTQEFDLRKAVPTRHITLTSETPFKKQSMSHTFGRGEFIQSLTYQNALTGERGLKARYISHSITRLHEYNKMDTLLPPAPDIMNRKPSVGELPKNYPSEIPKPKIENNIIDLTGVDFGKIEQTKIEPKFELKPSTQRQGRIFTVDEILKKGEKTSGGQSVKTGSKTMQIEKTKTATKEKAMPKTKENVLDLTKIDFRTLEKEATKTSIVEKTVPKVVEKSTPVPLLLPKVATIPELVEKVMPILKAKPIQKPKTREKPLIVPKIAEIPAQRFKVGLAFAPTTLEKTAFASKESIIEKTALSFSQSKTLANNLTSTQQITTPTVAVPSVDVKFKTPKLNVKLGSSIGGSGSSKRGKWAKLVTWF